MMLPETKVYGGRLKNRAELLVSSSGGAFTALTNVFLNAGNAVVCSVYNFNTHHQEYKIITTEEERNAARGSKYFQSILGNVFRDTEEWLQNNSDKNVLFVGMGCQAAGFKSYAQHKGFGDRVVIIDIICHGSPSPKLWVEYAESLEKQGKIEEVTFKDKRNGWNNPTALAIINGKEVSIQKYRKVFSGRNSIRLSCYKCPYTSTERKTDITIGDFWHIEDRIPDQYDKMGTSLFLVHTDKGMELFDRAKESLDWFESNTTECLQMNLQKPTSMPEERDKFWNDYYNNGINYIIDKYGTDSLMKKVKRKVKKLIRRES